MTKRKIDGKRTIKNNEPHKRETEWQKTRVCGATCCRPLIFHRVARTHVAAPAVPMRLRRSPPNPNSKEQAQKSAKRIQSRSNPEGSSSLAEWMAQKDCTHLIFTTKMAFPKSFKFMNSVSEHLGRSKLVRFFMGMETSIVGSVESPAWPSERTMPEPWAKRKNQSSRRGPGGPFAFVGTRVVCQATGSGAKRRVNGIC